MWISATVLLVGLLAVIIATEVYGLRFGGVVVVPLLAVYIQFDWLAAPLFIVSTGASFVTLLVIERRLFLYGRRLLITAIVAGALVPVTTVGMAQLLLGWSFPLGEVAYLGSILPGIAAYNLHRLDREDRITDIVGSLALVVALVLFAAFLTLLQSAATSPDSFEALLSTAERLVVEDLGPPLALPAPVLPRSLAVGLFVVGLLINEAIRKRYGLRLAGIIAVPLVALFSLHDARFLVLYLTVTATGAGFIRLVHRSSLLYGRSLLGGTCIVGVVLAALSAPLLPEAAGLRPLIVGILGGVTAYNGHVLAPGERIQSVVLSAAAFVVLFALADGLAILLGRPFTLVPTGRVIVFGCAVLAAGAFALLEFERRRPGEPIEPLDPEEAAPIPDGGTRTDGDELLPDGGAADPLGGRRVRQVAPNAERVYWDRGSTDE